VDSTFTKQAGAVHGGIPGKVEMFVPSTRFSIRPVTPPKEKVKSTADAPCGATKEPVVTARAAMDAPSAAGLIINSKKFH
jgi:hypothetical protein